MDEQATIQISGPFLFVDEWLGDDAPTGACPTFDADATIQDHAAIRH